MKVTLDPVYLLKGYATGCAAMFAGAALYINVAEHPARMTLDVVNARKQWVESFNRARYLQGALCAVGSLSGAAVFYLEPEAENRWLWLIGSGIFLLVFPWTAFVMKPDIKKNLQEDVIDTAGETWVMTHLRKWNSQHWFRTACAMTALKCFWAANAQK